MRRFELGMTLNYARNWSVADAIREFIQNALDEEKERPENKMSISYDNGVVRISNKKSKLSFSSLLLGSTTKSGNKNLIGEHGEGYKVATVVLMRNNISVKVYNNEDNTLWTSKVVNSRVYNTPIVVFDVEKKLFNHADDLIFEFEGVSEEDWNTVVEHTLFLRDDLDESKIKNTELGRILLDEKFKGNIYVEGLFVCNQEEFTYGFDFKAGTLKLDRDRGLVDSFDLRSAIADLELSTKDIDFIKESMNLTESYLLRYSISYKDVVSELCDSVYDDFIEDYGDDAVPVNNTTIFNEYSKCGVNAVMVSDTEYAYLTKGSRVFDKDSLNEKLDLDTRFNAWLSKVGVLLYDEYKDEIKELWKLARGKK